MDPCKGGSALGEDTCPLNVALSYASWCCYETCSIPATVVIPSFDSPGHPDLGYWQVVQVFSSTRRSHGVSGNPSPEHCRYGMLPRGRLPAWSFRFAHFLLYWLTLPQADVVWKEIRSVHASQVLPGRGPGFLKFSRKSPPPPLPQLRPSAGGRSSVAGFKL